MISSTNAQERDKDKEQVREEITVTGTLIPVDYLKLARAVTILQKEDIAKAPVHSIQDLLKYVLSVDMRQRAPFGIQSDITVRGSKFNQVLILVNGIKIHDPQTGHHTLDIPLSLADIERVEILGGQGSAAYGENAIGGVINIITKTSGRTRLSGSLSLGQHKTALGNLSYTFSVKKLAQTLSLYYGRSDGFMYDRDFETFNLTSITRTEIKDMKFNLLIGHNRKGFGANGFYAPFPSREWTRTTFAGLNTEIKKTTVKVYYRQHHDRFILDREQPDFFQNSHFNRSYGTEISSQFNLWSQGRFLLGAEIRRDGIQSLTLGDHSRFKYSAFSEYRSTFQGSFQFNAGLRGDNFSNYGLVISPSLSMSFFPATKLKFRASAGQAFRVPTFTELFYSSPANKGNPDLQPEKSLSLEMGADLYPAKDVKMECTLFFRKDRSLIDWIKRGNELYWHTENIHMVHFMGVETFLNFKNRMTLGYTFLRSNLQGEQNFLSKYVLNHPVHHVTASVFFTFPLDITTGLFGVYKQLNQGRSFVILDLKLSKKFKRMIFFIQVTNLLDIHYEEIPGVRMPGRWLITGFQFN